MGRLRELAKAETSYIWSGLANTIFPASPICHLQSGWISSTKNFIIIISIKYSMISLKIFAANFQTSPKMRIPQGWACSGGIGPNLFEEEIGKCENHKFPIKLPPPSVKFVTFNICWWSAVRLNLVPFSPFTCKQRSSHQSHIFDRETAVTQNIRPQISISWEAEVLTGDLTAVNKYQNDFRCIRKFPSLSLLVRTWLSGNWKVVGSKVHCSRSTQRYSAGKTIKIYKLW